MNYWKFPLNVQIVQCLQSPLNMLAHHLRIVTGSVSQGCFGLWRCLTIAQRNRDIAQPTLMADAANRRTFGFLQKLGFCPIKQLKQSRLIQSMSGFEIVFRAKFGEAVPRTHQLAIVATVNPIAQQGSQLDRDAAMQFDG